MPSFGWHAGWSGLCSLVRSQPDSPIDIHHVLKGATKADGDVSNHPEKTKFTLGLLALNLLMKILIFTEQLIDDVLKGEPG